MSTKRKLTTLTLREKFDVINAVKSGMKKKDVAAQYGLPASTLSAIIKKEAEILLRYESSSNFTSKRLRLADFPDLEECLITWFKQCRDKKISVSGPMLREKAKEFSKSLGHSSFRASNGWLENFKKRHVLVLKKVCGESASVNNELSDQWKIELQSLMKDCEPKDIITSVNRTEAQLKKCWDNIKTSRKGLAVRSLSPDPSRSSPLDEGLAHLPSDPLKQETPSWNGSNDNDSDATSKEFQVAEVSLGAAASLPQESRLADNEFSASQKHGSDPDVRNQEMMEELHKLKVAEQVWTLKTLQERYATAQLERQRAHEDSEKAKLEREKARFERDIAEFQREKVLSDLDQTKQTHTDTVYDK